VALASQLLVVVGRISLEAVDRCPSSLFRMAMQNTVPVPLRSTEILLAALTPIFGAVQSGTAYSSCFRYRWPHRRYFPSAPHFVTHSSFQMLVYRPQGARCIYFPPLNFFLRFTWLLRSFNFPFVGLSQQPHSSSSKKDPRALRLFSVLYIFTRLRQENLSRMLCMEGR